MFATFNPALDQDLVAANPEHVDLAEMQTLFVVDDDHMLGASKGHARQHDDVDRLGTEEFCFDKQAHLQRGLVFARGVRIGVRRS